MYIYNYIFTKFTISFDPPATQRRPSFAHLQGPSLISIHSPQEVVDQLLREKMAGHIKQM